MTVKHMPPLKVLQRGWSLFQSSWKPMAVYSVAVGVLTVAVLSPITSWILNRLVARSGELVIGNNDLVTWLLSPAGLLSLALWGTLALLGIVMQVTGLIWIAGANIREYPPTAGGALYRLLPALPSLFRFCFKVMLLCLVLLLPLAAGLILVYRTFLGSHDINYYLTVRPVEWKWALVCSASWLLLWAAAVGGLLLRWLYAFPLWLEGVRPFRYTLQLSFLATRRSLLSLLRVMGMCLGSIILVHLVLEGILFVAAGLIIRQVENMVNALFFTISVYLVSSTALNAAISLIGISWAVCILLVGYRADRPASLPEGGVSEAGEQAQKLPATGSPAFRGGLIAVALGTVLLASIGLSLFLLNRKPPDKVPVVIAHRAGAQHAPENSLAALETALRHEADYAEIDVQRTRDGVVVVNHDADLMRMSRDPRRVGETDYVDLARIDIGSKFHPDFAGQRIARLSDFLQRASGRIRLMIELKYYGSDPKLAAETIRLVREADMEQEVALMSLDLSAVRQCQRLAPSIRSGYLSAVGIGSLSRLELDFLAVSADAVSVELLRSARRRGLLVYVWTVNEVDTMLEMIELGVDGLITDDTPTAVEVISSVRELLPVERLLLRFRRFWDVFAHQGRRPLENTDRPRE